MCALFCWAYNYFARAEAVRPYPMSTDNSEKELFRKFEQQTNHQQLLVAVERLAKSGWLTMAIAIGSLLVMGERPVTYMLLGAALLILVVSFAMSVQAERLRRRIQRKVDRELGR